MHVKSQKQDSTCKGLKICACEKEKKEFACNRHAKQEKWEFACWGKRRRTRKTGKMGICVSVKKKHTRKNKKNGNLRVRGMCETGHGESNGKALHEMRFAQAAPWQQGILPQAGPSLLHCARRELRKHPDLLRKSG